MSTLDDSSLWKIADQTLHIDEQEEIQELLDLQNAGSLTKNQAALLQNLLDKYGRTLVQKSHAWLLLARRGYKVPVQQ